MLEPETVDSTLGALLKYQDDIKRIQGTEVSEILRRIEVVHQTVDSGKK